MSVLNPSFYQTNHASDATVSVDVARGIDGALYEEILRIRSEVGTADDQHKYQYTFDSYSDHYVLFIDHIATGALTVTRASQGPPEFFIHYPSPLLEHYQSVICTACKFGVSRGSHGTNIVRQRSIAKTLVRWAWADQVSLGSRLDVITVEKKHIPYYARMGYVHLADATFWNPIFHRESNVMILPVDPSRRSIAQDLFEQTGDVLLLDEVLQLFPHLPAAISMLPQNG